MSDWVDGAYVVGTTGREATQESIILAQTLVSIIGGVSEQAFDDEAISSSNLTNLKRAVAFEAVWLDDHPDVLSAVDVEGVSQDGLNATYATRYAHLIAPIAMLCLNRLSWRRGPIRVGRKRRYSLDRGNRDSAVRDDQYEWTPMHGHGIGG